jgi:glutamine amidotransferase
VQVAVIDYGAGNTRSVRTALQRLGCTTELTSDPSVVRAASYVVLPGVGSARSAMTHLDATGASDALRQRFVDGGPMLGICLGMQLAVATSEEDGGVTSLGLFPGVVRRLSENRVPRLGWEMVEPLGEAFYFAHSYYADTASATDFADGITAVVRNGSFIGCQFHPEKSGDAGAEFLAACLSRA